MTRRRILWFLIIFVLGGLLYPLLQGPEWVGATDLEVVFVVTDRASGEPVPGAQVEIHSWGGFYAENFEQNFTLCADPHGLARRFCRNSFCGGSSRWMGLKTRYWVRLPMWEYRVTAAGYDKTEFTYLNEKDYRAQVQKVDIGKTRLEVPVALNPSRTKQAFLGMIRW